MKYIIAKLKPAGLRIAPVIASVLSLQKKNNLLAAKIKITHNIAGKIRKLQVTETYTIPKWAK